MMSNSLLVYTQLFIAAICNIIAVFMMKKSQGFTSFWPSLTVLISIAAVQILVSRAMLSNINMGVAVTLVSVAVMAGSILMSAFIFNEALSIQKLIGLTIAIIGIVIASLSK